MAAILSLLAARTAREGGALAAEAVETQGKGTGLAVKAVRTHKVAAVSRQFVGPQRGEFVGPQQQL